MKQAIRRAKGAKPTARPKSFVPDDEDDRSLLPGAAPDPLAVEPLSAEEIKEIEARHPSATEQREAVLEVLRKGSEAKLPFDPDEAAVQIEAADQHLEVHTRPKRKR